MKPLLVTVSLLLGFAPLARAQDQATTLLRQARAADVVVRALVVGASDPSPDWHRIEFRAEETLAGHVAERFSVLEPAGACCGRSLFALQPGDACLLFLDRAGAGLHPHGGARGVLADEPEVVAHVRALLAAADDAARAAVLVAGLDSPAHRVAADAAHSLVGSPALPNDSATRHKVVSALTTAIGRGDTAAGSLVEVAVRCADAEVIDGLLPLYFAQSREDRAALLRRGLARCAPENLLDRLPVHLRRDEATELRAAELLVAMPAQAAAPALTSLLESTASPRVQLTVAERLLADPNLRRALGGHVPAVVQDLAERRRNAPPSFRAIRPGQR